jgi:TolB protein
VFHIALQDIATGNIRVLTQTALDESPSIAPNGAILLYATKDNKRGILAGVSLDAGIKYKLPAKSGDVREPAWSPFLTQP